MVTLSELLSAHRARDSAEEGDLALVRELVRCAGDPWTREIPLHATASGLVVHPPTRRVLLRWHAWQQAWLQVGGHADPGETDPLAVALREGHEETGLTDLRPWPGAALVQVAVVPVPAKGEEPAHEHADLRFLLATGTPGEVRPEKPGARLRWLTVPEAHELATEANVHQLLDRAAELF